MCQYYLLAKPNCKIDYDSSYQGMNKTAPTYLMFSSTRNHSHRTKCTPSPPSTLLFTSKPPLEFSQTAELCNISKGRLKCDGTHAETRFRLSAKQASPFKSAGASVQSTTGIRGASISGSNAGYTLFRGSVKGTGYPLHSPVFPLTSPSVRYRVPSHFYWILHISILL